MSFVKPSDAVTVQFTVTDPATGAATDADSLPTGTLVRNGANTAESVTVQNVTTGVYSAAVTIPAGYAAGDEVQIRIAATVGGVAGQGVVWTAQVDTRRVGELNDPTAAAIRSEIDSNSTQLAAIVADTGELQGDWVDGGRLDLIVDAILADTNELQADDVPGLIAALNDFDPSTENVTVGDIIAAALAKFTTDDTGETSVVAGSVAQLARAPVTATSFPAGAIVFTYTVTRSDNGNPIEGVDVWISTDVGGTNVVWRGRTDALGVARDVNDNKPMLDAGTYQFWRQLGGYTFNNPDEEVVS